MLYTKNTKKAINIMFEKHKNQVDKANIPYIYHPWYVADKMDDEDSTIVALLHDVLEDTDTSVEELQEYGFNQNIIDALVLLNHDKEIPYFEYIKNISENDLARKVKLKDLEHNSDLTRLDIITDTDIKRYKKYHQSITMLEEKNKVYKK